MAVHFSGVEKGDSVGKKGIKNLFQLSLRPPSLAPRVRARAHRTDPNATASQEDFFYHAGSLLAGELSPAGTPGFYRTPLLGKEDCPLPE